MSTKTFAPHIASLVAAFGAALALIHPGFKVPSVTEGVITTVCVLVAGAIQALHAVQHGSLVARVAAAEQYVKHAETLVASQATQPAPPQN